MPLSPHDPERSARCELYVVGPTAIRRDGVDLDDASVPTPKRLALLAYLALESSDGFRRRDQIVGVFWPDLDQDAARSQLRKALAAFRDVLGAGVVLTRGENEVRLDGSRVWCDAIALADHMKRGDYVEALALYRGELLEGLFVEGVSEAFESWLAERRRRLREHAADAASRCSVAEEERGDRKAAAVMARRALDLAPYDEDGMRRLMGVLDRQGDRAGALRAYADWQSRLQLEFGVEPAPETRKLARRIQAARKGESIETPPVPLLTGHGFAAAPNPSDQHTAAFAKHRWLNRAWWTVAISTMAVVAVGAAYRLSSPARDPRAIAAIPLRTIGAGDGDDAAAAFSEELLTSLGQRPDISLRPAASGADPAKAARELHAGYALTGAVQRAGSQLRVTLRLIEVRDGAVVWANAYGVESTAAAAMRQATTDAANKIIARITAGR